MFLFSAFTYLYDLCLCRTGKFHIRSRTSAPSAVLMEAETGQFVYAKDKDTRRSPASVTKIMTLILIFDHLHAGDISLTDPVTTSAHAKSMGGSQVFLEEGEQQSVETMINVSLLLPAMMPVLQWRNTLQEVSKAL